jgi:class 3 adenylate cyclase
VGEVARPSSVLVDIVTYEALTDEYTTRAAGGFSLKGFAEDVSLFRVTRSG